VALIGVYGVMIRFTGSIATLAMWVWAPVAVGLGVVLFLHRDKWQTSVGLYLFGGYFAYTALSLFWTPDPGRGLRFVALIGVAFLAHLYGRTIGAPTGGSWLWLGACAGVALALAGLLRVRNPPGFEGLNPDRILAMGVLALVVMAWYGPRGRLYTLGLGMAGVVIVLFSQSRTTSLVMVLFLITAPGLRLPRAGRLLITGSSLALVILLSLTPTFQDRWFESATGSFWDLVTIQGVNTSGRGEVWPVVAESCSSFILGEGAGASDFFASETHSGFPEPHNEFLRVWCDTGVIGTLLLWGFVVHTMIRALARIRDTPRPWPHSAALQLAVALTLISLTDNPLTTAIPFMIPAALAFGWSESTKEPLRFRPGAESSSDYRRIPPLDLPR